MKTERKPLEEMTTKELIREVRRIESIVDRRDKEITELQHDLEAERFQNNKRIVARVSERLNEILTTAERTHKPKKED